MCENQNRVMPHKRLSIEKYDYCVKKKMVADKAGDVVDVHADVDTHRVM